MVPGVILGTLACYGVARATALGCGELRNAVFAKVIIIIIIIIVVIALLLFSRWLSTASGTSRRMSSVIFTDWTSASTSTDKLGHFQRQ